MTDKRIFANCEIILNENNLLTPLFHYGVRSSDITNAYNN